MPSTHVPWKLHELMHASRVTVTPDAITFNASPPASVVVMVKVQVGPDTDGLVIRLIARE